MITIRRMSRSKIPDDQPMSRRTAYRRRAAAGLTRPIFRYPFNEAFFSEWSADLAWLVGLIWSDGNLTRNTIEICAKERDFMMMVADMIGQPNGVRPKNGGGAWRVVFTSKTVANFLRGVGLTPRKSFTVSWPVMPPEYEAHFIRGLFDGDGCVTLRMDRQGQQVADLQWEVVTASVALRDSLARWMKDRGVHARVSLSHTTVWRVSVSKQSSLRILHGLLYPSTLAIPCLLRKRQKFDEWMATPRVRLGRPRRSAV